MKTTTRDVIWGIVGAVAGYFLAKRHLAQEHESSLQKEKDKLKESYEKKYEADRQTAFDAGLAMNSYKADEEATPGDWAKWAKTLREAEKLTDPELKKTLLEAFPKGELPEPPDPVLPPYSASDIALAEKQSHVDYTRYSTPPVGNAQRDISTEVPEQTTDSVQTFPEKITPEEFLEERYGYDQKHLTYFQDGVLTNQHDEKIDPQAAILFLGEEYVSLLQAPPEARGGEDALYIRNRPRELEFEIIISESTYAKDVLGQTG